MNEPGSLDEILDAIEDSTGLKISSNLRKDLSFESLDAKGMYDMYLDYLRISDGKEPGVVEKAQYRMWCVDQKLLMMHANTIESKIYVCDEAIDYHYMDDADEVKVILKAHELGHFIMHELYPEVSELATKYSGTDEKKADRIDRLNEFFADYVMFKVNDTLDKSQVREENLSERIEYYFDRGWGHNSLLISKDVLKDIEKEIKMIKKS